MSRMPDPWDASLQSFFLSFEQYFEFVTLVSPHFPPSALLADKVEKSGFAGPPSLTLEAKC